VNFGQYGSKLIPPNHDLLPAPLWDSYWHSREQYFPLFLAISAGFVLNSFPHTAHITATFARLAFP
jgi:hypothetical protein